MELGDGIGPGIDEDLVAALEVRAPEVVRSETEELQVRARGAVEDDHALTQRPQVVAGGRVEAAEQFGADEFGGMGHGPPRIPVPRRHPFSHR